MEPLTILDNQQNQQFEIFIDDDRAWLEYRIKDNALYLMHTEVPENMAGKGVASALAAHAFNYARAHHMKIKAYCPFVVTWLKKHPEQIDIVIPPPSRTE